MFVIVVIVMEHVQIKDENSSFFVIIRWSRGGLWQLNI